MKIALVFGSFNPIHIGHIEVAQAARKRMDLDFVWFILTPYSPDKRTQADRLPAHQRLLLLRLALWKHPFFSAKDIELSLPAPQYTVNTLRLLAKDYPEHDFSLLMGEDNVAGLHMWREATWILTHYSILVYRRSGAKIGAVVPKKARIRYIEGRPVNISSTQIRSQLRNGQDVSTYLPDAVWKSVQKRAFYR